MHAAPADRSMPSVVMALTYYAPYVSGLTEAARMVAEELAARGARVQVATTRHDPSLPPVEVLGGVEVHRAPVVARFGKGTVSPAFPVLVRRLAAGADVLNLHLPLLEGGLLARTRTPVVTTYQCDVTLGGAGGTSAVDRLQERVLDASSRAAFRRSAAVAVSSEDYAERSRVWPAMRGRTVTIAPPARDRRGGSPSLRRGPGLHVGFLGRLVEEKGVEHLVEAFLALDDPDARLLVGGDYMQVAGGSVVDRVRAQAGSDPRIELLGHLPEELLPDLYASLDVFALPSVNALEAFGIVQVEAMMCGVPVVASDLPGVRTIVNRTGFGRLVAPRDVAGLTAALRELSGTVDREQGAARARAAFGVGPTTDAYLELFRSVRR